MSNLDRSEKLAAGCGVLAILGYVVFWGAIIYVAIHFIGKFW